MFAEQIAILEKEIKSRYGGHRLETHIFSVAELARDTAEALDSNQAPSESAYLCGLAHDLFKGWPQKNIRKRIQNLGVPIDRFSLESGGGLLHAPVAAHYLSTELGIKDKDIIAAVYYHTTSRAGASLLEKIIFCSDYLEPTRPSRGVEPDVAELRESLAERIENVYLEIVARKIKFTLDKSRPLHPDGIAAWNDNIAKRKSLKSVGEKQ